MSPASMKTMVVGLLRNRLAELGFEQRKHGVFTTIISDHVIGWLGLNTATWGERDFLQVNPVVGLRNQPIERLVAELTGDLYDEVIPATISTNVGYISPTHNYMTFDFTRSTSDDIVADQLCVAVKTFGLPFMKDSSDLRTLVETMGKKGFGLPFQIDYRIPVGMWLLGDINEAKAFITRTLSKMTPRTDPAAGRYRQFAARLREQLEHA